MFFIEVGLAFVLLAGFLFRTFPPKKINSIYGWRTRFSMKNQRIWDEAQRYSANVFIAAGSILAVVGLILFILFKNSKISGYLQFAGVAIAVIVIYIVCESHLRKKFKEADIDDDIVHKK